MASSWKHEYGEPFSPGLEFTELQQQIYSRMQTNSRRALSKLGRLGHQPKRQAPRWDLVVRIGNELKLPNMTIYQEWLKMKQKCIAERKRIG